MHIYVCVFVCVCVCVFICITLNSLYNLRLEYHDKTSSTTIKHKIHHICASRPEMKNTAFKNTSMGSAQALGSK